MTQKKRILFCGEASSLSTGFSTYYRELIQRLVATGKYEIAEFGSYVRQDDPKVHEFVRGRWKFYGVMPLNDEEFRVFNQPCAHPRAKRQNTNQFGEYKFDAVVADFQPDMVVDIRDFWMCFPGDTDIVTRNGVRHIRDIREGDDVLTHTGNYHPVKTIFRRKYNGDIHTIKCSHVGMSVSMTPEHPVLCYKRNNIRPTNLPDVSNIKPTWLPASNIDKYDLLCYPVPREIKSEKWNISHSFARLLGYYAAEGCVMYEGLKESNLYKGIQFAFGIHEEEYVQEVYDALLQQYGVHATIKRIEESNTIVVRAYGRSMSEHFLSYIHGTAYEKSFEGGVIHARRDIIAQVLCGLLRGDGCLNDRRASYCTASKTLAHQTFNMLIALGIMPSFNLNKNTLNDDTFYRYIFSIRGRSLDGFREVYNFGVVPSSRDSRRINDKYAFITVTSKSINEYHDDVFNFEVDEDNSYVTSFAVHNCEYQERSVFRPWYKWVPMPTVDAEPQAEEWIQVYENADLVLAYSDFGVHALRRQSQLLPNGKRRMRIFPKAMRPGVDLNIFQPKDKAESKSYWNLNAENPVIGTVMRNQSRKLYPDLIDAFSLMKRKYKGESAVDKAVLLIHSSWPDNQFSYDYPRHIMRLETLDWMPYASKGIRSSIMQSMFCHACNKTSVTYAVNLHNKPIQDGRIKLPCPYCGEIEASPPSVGLGFSREELSNLYNAMDLYVQCSICEGDGMPIQEAKACGVPTLMTDYSAMREKGRFPSYPHFEELGITEDNYTCPNGGEVIKVGRYYYEPETSCKRAHPDIEDMADKMRNMVTDSGKLRIMGKEARECAEENYDWDQLAKQWEYVLDNVKIKDRSQTWDSPISSGEEIKAVPMPDGMNNEQFIEWLYVTILNYPAVDPEGARTWMQHLEAGVSRERLLQQFIAIGNQQADHGKIRDQIRQRVKGITPQPQKRNQEFI